MLAQAESRPKFRGLEIEENLIKNLSTKHLLQLIIGQ
jgi:hypothetical protein